MQPLPASGTLSSPLAIGSGGWRRASPISPSGNPHEMPLAGIVTAIRDNALPHDKNWFACKTSEEEPQRFLAERVGRELGLAFEPADIALTSGAFAAIMVAFRLVLDAGDEAIVSEPAWFCYEPMLLAADVAPRKVALKAPAAETTTPRRPASRSGGRVRLSGECASITPSAGSRCS